MLEKIYLIDLEPSLIKEWDSSFSDIDIFETVLGDYFDIEADCMVSPANSFGFMDGGLDRAIIYELGPQVQDNVQAEIVRNFHGELPVGCAVLVETRKSKWPHLVAAPTMRVPEDVSGTVNAFLAFRAILLEISRYNLANTPSPIKTLVCPGLATGIGKLPSKNCAVQMRMAYDRCASPAAIPNLGAIHTGHFNMRSKF